MEISEKALNDLCLKVAADHFPGLKLRPVKIDNSISFFAVADESNMLFNASLHRSRKVIKETIIHELIHYELRDCGKDYDGHGDAFKKRAKQLGILGAIELSQCFSTEQLYYRPHRTEIIKIPLAEYGKEIEKSVKSLKQLAGRAPMNLRERIFLETQSIEATWICYKGAIERGEDHVFEERITFRRSPKGKSLETLRQEEKELESRSRDLLEKFKTDPKVLPELKQVNRKLYDIAERIERDWHQ